MNQTVIRKMTALFAAAVLMLGSTVTIKAAGSYAPIYDGVYTIQNMYTRDYLTYSNGKVTEDYQTSGNAQQWRISLEADGSNTITPVNATSYRLAVHDISYRTELTTARTDAEVGYTKWEARTSNGGYVLTPKGTYNLAMTATNYPGDQAAIDFINVSSENGVGLNYCWEIKLVSGQQYQPQTAAAPTVNYPGGTYTSAISLTLTCTTQNASIYYTADGSDPAYSQTRKKYTAPINISATVTIRAMTEAPGYSKSPNVTYSYSILNQQWQSGMVIRLTIGNLAYTKNNTTAYFDVAPYIERTTNRAMVPIRFIAEALGANVSWEDRTKTDTITLNGRTLKIVLNQDLPNNMGRAVIVQSRLFVPVRYVSEQLGAKVDWDASGRTVTITR